MIAAARSIEADDDPGIVAVEGDIADPETAQRIVDAAIERFGRIDTLINNAGLYIGKPFTDYTLEDFNALVAVNLAGFFHITTRTIKHMLERGMATWSMSRRRSSRTRTAADLPHCPC